MSIATEGNHHVVHPAVEARSAFVGTPHDELGFDRYSP
jgi:hypothetical protein